MVLCQVPLRTIGLKLADTCGFCFIGVIYFIFMLGEPISVLYTLTSVWMMSIPVFVVPGIINIILVLQWQVCLSLVIGVIVYLMRTKVAIQCDVASWLYTVSTDTSVPNQCSDCFAGRLQVALHGILSTRIVLHLFAVSNQDLVESRPTVGHPVSGRIQFRSGTRMSSAGD